jgi:hypothetical protein
VRRSVVAVVAVVGACAGALAIDCTPFGEGSSADGGTTPDGGQPDVAPADAGGVDGAAVDPCNTTLTEHFDGDFGALLPRWPLTTQQNGTLSLVATPAVSEPGSLVATTKSGQGNIDVALQRKLGRCPKVTLTFSLYMDLFGGEPDLADIAVEPGNGVEPAYIVVHADAVAKELQFAEYSNAFGYHFIGNKLIETFGWRKVAVRVDTRAGTFGYALDGQPFVDQKLTTAVSPNAEVGIALGVADYIDPRQSLTVRYDELVVETSD